MVNGRNFYKKEAKGRSYFLSANVNGGWVVGTIAGAPGGYFGSKSSGSQEWIKKYGIFYPSNLNKTKN